jgi:hypothetical protein
MSRETPPRQIRYLRTQPSNMAYDCNNRDHLYLLRFFDELRIKKIIPMSCLILTYPSIIYKYQCIYRAVFIKYGSFFSNLFLISSITIKGTHKPIIFKYFFSLFVLVYFITKLNTLCY